MNSLTSGPVVDRKNRDHSTGGQWPEAFRAKTHFRNVGVVCTCFFGAMGVLSTIVAVTNPDGSFPRPLLAAIFLGLVWTAFTLLGLWLIVFYQRYRLYLSGTELLQVGAISRQTVRWKDIRELHWRLRPVGGSVRICAASASFVVDLSTLPADDRETAIAHVREHVSEQVQSGWSEFQAKFLQIDPEKQAQSRRLRMILVFAVFGHAVAFFGVWLVNREAPFLVLSLVNLAVAAWCVRSTRKSTPDAEGKQHRPR